jgi:hypothetical protein
MHFNAHGKAVTKEQLKKMIEGVKSIYFAGFLEYEVDGVAHETPFCGFTTKQHDIPNCLNHNEPF